MYVCRRLGTRSIVLRADTHLKMCIDSHKQFPYLTTTNSLSNSAQLIFSVVNSFVQQLYMRPVIPITRVCIRVYLFSYIFQHFILVEATK